MYFDTRIEFEYEVMNEMIEREMRKLQNDALGKLSSLFAHSKTLIKEFSLTLAYSYFDSYEPAETIAKELDLDKLDFLAIQEDFDAFKEEYLKNYEEAQNF